MRTPSHRAAGQFPCKEDGTREGGSVGEEAEAPAILMFPKDSLLPAVEPLLAPSNGAASPARASCDDISAVENGTRPDAAVDDEGDTAERALDAAEDIGGCRMDGTEFENGIEEDMPALADEAPAAAAAAAVATASSERVTFVSATRLRGRSAALFRPTVERLRARATPEAVPASPDAALFSPGRDIDESALAEKRAAASAVAAVATSDVDVDAPAPIFSLFSLLLSLWSLLCALCSFLFALCSLLFALCSLLFDLCSLLSALHSSLHCVRFIRAVNIFSMGTVIIVFMSPVHLLIRKVKR